MESMEIAKITLIRNLKDLRKSRDWNQEDLAEKTGYSRGFIADIERGKSWVSPEAIEEIAKAFKVPIERLFQTESIEQASVASTPVSVTLKKMMAIPDSIYELSTQINPANKDAWDAIAVAIKRQVTIQNEKASHNSSQA